MSLVGVTDEFTRPREGHGPSIRTPVLLQTPVRLARAWARTDTQKDTQDHGITLLYQS